MQTIRKANKIHTCAYCNGNIQIGEKYIHVQDRLPDYSGDCESKQTGVFYANYRAHDKNCFPRLMHFPDAKNVLKNCNHGRHSITWDTDPDATDMNDYCEWCGIKLDENGKELNK